jgi:hypothetical protein
MDVQLVLLLEERMRHDVAILGSNAQISGRL